MKHNLSILITRFPYSSSLGGEELHSRDLANELIQRGHQITLLSSDPVLTNLFEKIKGAKVKRIFALKAPVSISMLIVFTLLCPLYFFYLNFFLLKHFFKNKKKQRVIYMHSLGEKLLMSLPAYLLSYKVIWVEHARIGGWLIKNPWVVIYKLLSRISHIITPSRQTAEPIKNAHNIHVIPHGIPFDQAINNEKKAHTNKREFNVLCVARLSQDKGVDYLIKAFRKLAIHTNKKIILSIVGKGLMEAELKDLTSQLFSTNQADTQNAHVLFKGKVDQKEIFREINRSDCLVLPSSEHDPFGLTILEAMHMKTATICTDVCGVSEFVEKGIESIVTQARDEDALYIALSALCTNPELRHEIASKGFEATKSTFSYKRMVNAYEKLFKA